MATNTASTDTPTKTNLRFEYGALDKEPLVLSDDWFQITYESIRDSNDFEVAFFVDGLWFVPDNQETYSDIVLYQDV